jgi:DNA-binding beta-propeller fold protein YncE/peroxiredoxin
VSKGRWKKILFLGALALAGRVWTQGQPGDLAPEFPSSLAWLNSKAPIELKDLRGKVVLLDFWTFCCINCMHVLPELAKLEEKYKDELVILGVHSAKFSNEQATKKIRQAILRYKIQHPVINDHDSEVWDLYDVHAWPTLILINPAGKIVKRLSGEGVYEALDSAIAVVAATAQRHGELRRGAFSPRLESSLVKDSPLAFPGKVLADAVGQRLFVSDSNHGRIVVAHLKSGAIQQLIHSGLRNPQGLALSADGAALYVADTDSGALRKVDLKTRQVTTLAEKLNSPWDLCLVGDALFVAMAGSHQIWRLDLKSGKIKPYAGNGREDIVDGGLEGASFAQPSGITADGAGHLFSADSETSSIRSLDLDPSGRVRSLVGRGLFDYGNIDGDAKKARLQHPLGVHYYEGKLYVADTYNHKIRVIDPVAGGASSLLGNGLGEFKDGRGREARFDEPSGLWAAEGKLYIADTNNHAIRVADLSTGEVSTFLFKGLK